jgi:lipoprotein-anchoring transpeptidase ErfK/SrfK
MSYQDNRKAIRYGEAAWSGVAKIGNMTEWPSWTPTATERERLGPLPAFVPGGPGNPMGARAMYLFANGKDTLFRMARNFLPLAFGVSSQIEPGES